jgi:hypothetical protein
MTIMQHSASSSIVAKISTMSPIAIDGLEKLMDRTDKAHGLRNQIAHCTWTPGTRPGTIKPMVMSAQRKALKMLGIEHNEKQWTADELKAEVKRYQEVGKDLALFMKRNGLM